MKQRRVFASWSSARQLNTIFPHNRHTERETTHSQLYIWPLLGCNYVSTPQQVIHIIIIFCHRMGRAMVYCRIADVGLLIMSFFFTRLRINA